jgi:hypothetical protein
VLLLAQRLAGYSIGLVAVFDNVQVVPGKVRLILHSTPPRGDISAIGVGSMGSGSDLGAMLMPRGVQCNCSVVSTMTKGN